MALNPTRSVYSKKQARRRHRALLLASARTQRPQGDEFWFRYGPQDPLVDDAMHHGDTWHDITAARLRVPQDPVQNDSVYGKIAVEGKSVTLRLDSHTHLPFYLSASWTLGQLQQFWKEMHKCDVLVTVGQGRCDIPHPLASDPSASDDKSAEESTPVHYPMTPFLYLRRDGRMEMSDPNNVWWSIQLQWPPALLSLLGLSTSTLPSSAAATTSTVVTEVL